MSAVPTRSQRRSRPATPSPSASRTRTGRGVVTLYGELADVAPSPIVELNRAVAVSMAFGPEAGLDLVDQLCESGTLDGYRLLYGVRGIVG